MLSKDESIIILPANKGNITVILDRSEYQKKMLDMLNEPTYRKLKRNPTTRIEKRVMDAIKRVESSDSIPEKLKHQLTPQFSRPPQIYGLPKVHKNGISLGPIVAYLQSGQRASQDPIPTHGRTNSFVKNSAEFAQRIRNEMVNEGDLMVSFDVVSLFTNMPVDDALRSISTLLSNDDTLEERTTFRAGGICHLTELCLRATYFQFGDQFFEQVDGAAMGSLLSPIVANLYMETFERETLASAVTAPRLWLRYVDDTFVIWS